jgi:NAD(P)H-dependent flavin oxidoreductase YrpB (nitropropane dioxygenase family)
MPPRWNENPLTAKLGIDYPTIQGPLGGLSSQKLTAAVSNFAGSAHSAPTVWRRKQSKMSLRRFAPLH